MFRWQVFFAGPKSRWSERIDPTEIIASGEHERLFQALGQLMKTFRPLDKSRCGFAFAMDDKPMYHYDPVPDGPRKT
jgi:hypothetical protein